MNRRICGFLLIALSLVLLSSSGAWAHKVSVWAFVDGDIVSGEAYFSAGSPAKNCPVTVYDRDGGKVLSLRSDEEGLFSFPIDDLSGKILIVLDAGMGHRGEMELELTDEAEVDDRKDVAGTSDEISEAISVSHMEISREDLARIVEESVRSEVAPLKEMLAESVKTGPGLVEVLGGLGYIVGIASLMLLARERGRRK